ncbi:hypothetical protein ACFFWA_15715 [Actinomadura verrucosospora]|uniref:hypothetical protein n=1 Tax=Actinomadura TaxID=1988 RepID=UPI0031EA7F63
MAVEASVTGSGRRRFKCRRNRYESATLPSPRRSHGATPPGRWTRRTAVAAPAIAARSGRPAARAGMADRDDVRDLHALLPVFF